MNVLPFFDKNPEGLHDDVTVHLFLLQQDLQDDVTVRLFLLQQDLAQMDT